MEHRTKAAMTLAEEIGKAMNDLESTKAECEEIVSPAQAAGDVDPIEQKAIKGGLLKLWGT